MERIEMNVHEAKRMLDDVPQEEKFLLNDGKQLANLTELEEALGKMPHEAFSHHVNSHKNDFANWIQDCVKDPELAKVVRHLKDQKGIKAAIKGRTALLKKEMKKDWLKNRFAKWELLDFALGIMIGTGIAAIVVFF